MTHTAEQLALRDIVRSLLARHASDDATRQHMEGDAIDPALWAAMADVGLQGLAIPEYLGGAGAGWTEQSIVFEELGRTLACVPYLSTAALATAGLLASTESARERWLPGIADGSLAATVAFGTPAGASKPNQTDILASDSGRGWVLNGRSTYVVDGATADLILVAARTDRGISLFATETAARESVPTSDLTRRVAHLTFTDAAATLVGEETAIIAAHRAGLAMLANEQVGGSTACLDMSVDYAKVREQFGRPIGSFQAVQHLCANMLISVESARSAAQQAARSLEPDHTSVALASLIAGAACGDAYAFCASTNVQVHGGIGFTWEHAAQLHVKRSRGSLVLLGRPSDHRQALMDSKEVLVGL